MATVCDNFRPSYSQKNDFDLVTSSDLDLGSRHSKSNQLVPGFMSNHSTKFHKGVIGSF